MRTKLLLLAAPLATLISGTAFAQPPGPQPSDPSSTQPPSTSPSPATTGEPVAPPTVPQNSPGSGSPAPAGAPVTDPEQGRKGLLEQNGTPTYDQSKTSSRLLVPRYAEDFYPAQPKENGLMSSLNVPVGEEAMGLRFSLHGYFRAPMRVTRVPRAEGSTKPNEGNYNIRTPFLVDDDYFKSGFAYTPVNETDWAEIYLSVGNKYLTATMQLQGTLFSDAARPIIDRQPGISQGWLTYRTDFDWLPGFHTRLRVKAGAFWERFGHLPKYDTYIFARIHQLGENIRLELERDEWTFWLQHGVGTHLEDIAANQGLALLHYASLGASWNRTIEVGGYVFDSTSRDKRQLKEITDSSLVITGLDVRADTHLFGRVYGATSFITADQARYQAPAIETMHSFGGRGLEENYLGTQSSNNGTGELWNVGFQYDASLADIYRGWTGKGSPLPWNGDLTAALFGMYTFTQSKQSLPDPILNRDDKKSFKWGAEAGYRIAEWFGASLRYDRVVLDVDDSANSFRILSPRLSFFTSFLTREMIYLQYSRYIYNERIRLRQGQVQLETMPDDHVIKLQAQITF